MRIDFDLSFYGDCALLLQFQHDISPEIHLAVKSVYLQLKKMHIIGVKAIVPAYCSIVLHFNPKKIASADLKMFIEHTPFYVDQTGQENTVIPIPVCYDDEYALDMEVVLALTGLSKKEIIHHHTQNNYLVYMLGFTPGFLYLGGLDKKLWIPRKQTPRLHVQAGSVGLADQQTGIYPLDTPGGWQIIGKTPTKLFEKNKKFSIKMGDVIQFYEISKKEFLQLSHGN